MNIRKTIITTAVALTTVALIAPAAAGAMTIAELQAQINALMAQLQAMQGPVSGTPAACVGVTFTRNLKVGMTGSDVKCLQASMNALGYQVSVSGAGSPGNETMYFGAKTLVAVNHWQVAVLGTSATQFGPMSRAKLNSWLGGSSTTTTTTPVPTGAGLTVMLASDNPATGTVVDASALYTLLKLVFVNGDNAEVKVTGLKLQRIGVSADASVTNTYLFKGAERLTDGAAVSSTMVNFNNTAGLFTVPSNGSVTISVLADVDGTASETVGMKLVSASDVTSNASSTKGTYPLMGNLATIATGTLAGVNFGSTTPAAASVDPQDGYTVWQNSVTVTTRAADMTRISFRKTGSVSNTDLQNFKLYVDGVQVGSTMQLAKDSSGADYVTFDLMSAPKRLEAGTRVVKVLADIIGGSNLNFTMHLWNVADATFVDTQYFANILAQSASTTFSKRSTGQQSVNAGTLTITKTTDSPSGDIVDAASNALFGKWQLKAAGEKIKVETLNMRVIFTNTVTTGDDTASSTSFKIRNGILLANGVQVGSTTSTTDQSAGTQFSLGSSLIVVPGSPVTLVFQGDVFDNATTNDIDATDTLQASIVAGSSNATGQVSATTLSVPSVATTANVMTVRQGSLTLSKYTAYTNNTVVSPLTAYKMGHWTLTAATSEAVNLTAINLSPNSVASSNASNIYVKYGTQTTTVKPSTATSYSWSINYSLPAGQTIDVMVYDDHTSSAVSGAAIYTLDVDGTTANSAVTADSTAVAGQSITFSSGAFATSFIGNPQDQAVSGNQSVLAGRFKLTSSYQNYTVKELRFRANSNQIAISSATLKDGATGATLATVPYDGTNDYFNFTGLSVAVPASTSKIIDAYWNFAVPSATNASTNLNTVATLTYIKYADPNGTETTDSTTTRTANVTLVYKAVPTLTQIDLNNSSYVANGGEQDLYKFTVAAPSQGDVSMKQFKLAVVWSDGGTGDTLKLHTLKLLKDGADITSSVTIQSEDGYSAEGTSGVSENDDTIAVTWDGSTEDTVLAGSSTTYTVKGTPAGFRLAATDNPGTDAVSLAFTRDASAQTSGFTFLNAGSTVTSIVKLFSSAAAGDSTALNETMIWSDNSAVAHAPAVGTGSTKDWSNSYLIQNVLSSEAWSR